MTQEDGLKLLQYNVTKYTNLFYISYHLAFLIKVRVAK